MARRHRTPLRLAISGRPSVFAARDVGRPLIALARPDPLSGWSRVWMATARRGEGLMTLALHRRLDDWDEGQATGVACGLA